MANNELGARRQNAHYTYLEDEQSPRTGGHTWRERVVETEDGPLNRVLAIDGRALSPSEAQAETERIIEIVRDPTEFRRTYASHRNDEARIVQLLQLLPKAFIFKPDGEEEGCTRFTFLPNPDFSPSTYEERIVHALGGTVAVRQPIDRLCMLHASFLSPVEFGYGFLGRVNQGGYFTLKRIPVEGGNWKTNWLSVHVEGRVLLLKNFGRERQVSRSELKMLTQPVSVAQAAGLLSNR